MTAAPTASEYRRFLFQVGDISSFVRLREMLESAQEPWQAEIIRARLEQQLAHRAARRAKRRAREAAARADAERDNDARLGR